MFHKTLFGATVGDVITSMIATAAEAGANVFEYFTVLQQNKDDVKLILKVTYHGIIWKIVNNPRSYLNIMVMIYLGNLPRSCCAVVIFWKMA